MYLFIISYFIIEIYNLLIIRGHNAELEIIVEHIMDNLKGKLFLNILYILKLVFYFFLNLHANTCMYVFF